MRLPGKLEPQVEDLLISAPDLYPTMLGLMGKAGAIPERVTGTNFAPLLADGEGERPSSQLYLKLNRHSKPFGMRGVRTDRYTLVIQKRSGKDAAFRLWDRENDPYQLKNIAKESPNIIDRLIEKELVPWLKRTDDPFLETLRSSIERPGERDDAKSS